MNAGANIRKLRVEAGYTQKQLAAVMGVKPAYVSALERGVRRPGNKILPLLCDALGVDEMTVLFGPRERPLHYGEKAAPAAVPGAPGPVSPAQSGSSWG